MGQKCVPQLALAQIKYTLHQLGTENEPVVHITWSVINIESTQEMQ